MLGAPRNGDLIEICVASPSKNFPGGEWLVRRRLSSAALTAGMIAARIVARLGAVWQLR